MEDFKLELASVMVATPYLLREYIFRAARSIGYFHCAAGIAIFHKIARIEFRHFSCYCCLHIFIYKYMGFHY